MPIPVDVQSLPVWLRAAVFLGVPSVIALFLVYVLTTTIASRVERMETAQLLMQQSIAALAKAAADRQADADDTRTHFDDASRQLIRSVRQLCVAISETPTERANCLNDRPIE